VALALRAFAGAGLPAIMELMTSAGVEGTAGSHHNREARLTPLRGHLCSSSLMTNGLDSAISSRNTPASAETSPNASARAASSLCLRRRIDFMLACLICGPAGTAGPPRCAWRARLGPPEAQRAGGLAPRKVIDDRYGLGHSWTAGDGICRRAGACGRAASPDRRRLHRPRRRHGAAPSGHSRSIAEVDSAMARCC